METSTDPFADVEAGLPDDDAEAAERLGGYNPGDDGEGAGSLPGEDATPVESPEPEEPVAPLADDPAEAEEAVAEAEAEEALIEDEPDPLAEDEPEPSEPEGPKSKARTYLVFERFEDKEAPTGAKFHEVGDVEARNAENALRKAYRKLAEERDEYPETTLVVVAERMWRPTPIKARAPRTAMAIELG